MADEEQPAAPAAGTYDPATLNTIIQQLMQQPAPPQPVAQPSSTEGRGALSLLGEAIGGGEQYGTTQQREAAGLRALQSMGMNMMANSGYAPVRTPFGQILASGMQGAQQSLGESQSVEAAQMGAQQQYAEKQQEMQLERLKTVLPLLRMQQGAGMPNLLAGGNTSVAQGGSIADPAAALPKDQALAAVVQRESGGKNIPTAILGSDGKPASTATGYYQMLDNTWQEGAALAGIKNPPPRAMDASKADQDAAASALYDKYKLMPWAKSAPTPTAPSGAPPASTASTTPPAAPVVHTSPTLRGPGTPVPPTPQPSIQGVPDSGGTQVGGPGALPGKVAPPGPAVPGDVNAIIAGMKGGGADPTTLAPGAATAGPAAPTIAQAGPPTVTPPAQPTPQVSAQGDQPPAPSGPLTIEQYRAQHPSVINPSTYTVTPPGLADALAAKQTFAQNLQSARAAGDITGANKAAADYQTASQNVATLQQQAQSKSLELQQAAQKNADDLTLQGYNAEMQRRQEAQLKAQELAQTVAENEKQRQAAAALETQRGEQAIKLEQAKGSTASETKVMDALNETHETARGAIDQLQLARSLSASAGDPTFWQGIQQSHPSLVRWLANIGSLSDDQVTQLGQSGAMDAALQKLVTMARAGSGFQRVTNMDLQLLQSQAPTGTDPQQWRDAKLAYLQSYMERQMRYVDAVRTLRADGTPLYQAQTQADKAVGDVVPQMPSFTDQPGNSGADQRHRWAADNVQPGTFFRTPDGKRMLIYQGQ